MRWEERQCSPVCSGAAAHAPLCSDYTGHSSSGVTLTLLTCHRYRSSVLLSDTVQCHVIILQVAAVESTTTDFSDGLSRRVTLAQ